MTWLSGLLIAAALIGSYLLYDSGYMILKSKRAVTFVGTNRKNGFSFQVTGCTGFVSRVLRVKENGTYTVTLDAGLSKGAVRFRILDGAKTEILTLTPEQNQGGVYLESGRRYYARMEFTHASGDSRAQWEKT